MILQIEFIGHQIPQNVSYLKLIPFENKFNLIYFIVIVKEIVKLENKRTRLCILLKKNQLVSTSCGYRSHDRGYLNWGLTKKQDGYYLITNRVTWFYL